MSTGVIRPVESLEELRAVVALQEEVWGRDFSERVPVAVLKIVPRLGGVTAGAFDDEGVLLGFVFGLTGPRDGRTVHWSHMLAVRPGHEGRGLGRRLKEYQRERLLEIGVTRAYWTFDPLESRNAWLNLVRLGAVATEYLPDMYGDTDSPRHRGVGTDRLLAVWDLDSDRVRERVDGGRSDRSVGPPDRADGDGLPRAFEVETGDALPRPVGPTRIPPERPFLVPVPRNLQQILSRDPELGRRWREATREALRPALDAGDRVGEVVPCDDETAFLRVEAS